MENQFSHLVKEKSDKDLLEMVYDIDTWDAKMLNAVELEMKNRNILPEDVELKRQQFIQEEESRLAQGKAASIGGQIFGWLGVAGIFGLIIGYNYAFSKVKSKYSGKTYFEYNSDTRNNGTYIFYTCLGIWILFFFYKIVTLT